MSIKVVPKSVTINGVSFEGFPRSFTRDERDTYKDVAKKHGFFELALSQKEHEDRRKAQPLDRDVASLDRKISALNTQLWAELAADPEDWDDEKQERLEAKLGELNEKRDALEIDVLRRNAENAKEDEARASVFLDVQALVWMETLHSLLDDAPPLEAWLESYSEADVKEAEVLVGEGLKDIPLNRARRRAQTSGKKPAKK